MTVDLYGQLDAAQQAYFDNADYFATGSLTKAQAFLTACTKLLALIPSMSRQSGRSETGFNTKAVYAQQMIEARQFILAAGGNQVRFVDLTQFRT